MAKDDEDKVKQAESSVTHVKQADSSVMDAKVLPGVVGGTGKAPLLSWGNLDVSCPNCPRVYPVKVLVRSDGPLSRRAYCVDCGAAVDIEITVRPGKESADG